jgi:polyhydroxyalkanoate synthesis regulator phasin
MGDVRAMSTKWIKIFKAGTHTDSKGEKHTYTVDDLDNMVQLYNDQPEESRRKAPHVLGHPKDNSPAYGWVGKLKRSGEFLMASCEEMSDEFVEAVNKGAYKFRSASIYPSGLLRHVGWLGATQPAIAGLGEASFSEDDGSITFDHMEWDAAWRFERLASLMQRFREWIIESDGIETADKVIAPWEIDNLRPPPATEPEFNEPQPPHKDNDMDELMKQQLETLQREFTQVNAERDALKAKSDAQAAELSTLKTQVADLAAQNTRREIESYCEGLIAAGKMLPSEKSFFVDDLIAKSTTTADFAENESPFAKTKAMLDARPAHKLFQEHATGERAPRTTVGASNLPSGVTTDPESEEQYAQIEKVMKERNIDFNEALEIVMSEV